MKRHRPKGAPRRKKVVAPKPAKRLHPDDFVMNERGEFTIFGEAFRVTPKFLSLFEGSSSMPVGMRPTGGGSRDEEA